MPVRLVFLEGELGVHEDGVAENAGVAVDVVHDDFAVRVDVLGLLTCHSSGMVLSKA